MTHREVNGNRSRADADVCTAEERAEFRSCVGNLHWVTAQTRLDRAVDTSKYQKKQNAPSWGDYKGLSKVVREVKASAEVGLRLRPIAKPVIGVWTDSSLYGANGELADPDLVEFEKHALYSHWEVPWRV